MVRGASARDSMVRNATMKIVLLALAVVAVLSIICYFLMDEGKPTSIFDERDV